MSIGEREDVYGWLKGIIGSRDTPGGGIAQYAGRATPYTVNAEIGRQKMAYRIPTLAEVAYEASSPAIAIQVMIDPSHRFWKRSPAELLTWLAIALPLCQSRHSQ
jgi:hypothetical protein